jgi:hypothetical protein
MNTQAQAYKEGWFACVQGLDGRWSNPYLKISEEHYAWTHGFLDAMEAEDDELPEPGCAGYTVEQEDDA